MERLVESVQQIAVHTEGKSCVISLDPKTVGGAVNQVWRDVKGATAVAIASV